MLTLEIPLLVPQTGKFVNCELDNGLLNMLPCLEICPDVPLDFLYPSSFPLAINQEVEDEDFVRFSTTQQQLIIIPAHEL